MKRKSQHYPPNPQLLTLSRNELSAKDTMLCVYTTMRLMTLDREKSDLIVYTGYVTSTFLERFRRPRRVPIAYIHNSIGMAIDYVCIPIWPILDLRERLGKALGEDIAGVFDQKAMKTWEEDAVPLTPSSKRQRDATYPNAGPRAVNGKKCRRD